MSAADWAGLVVSVVTIASAFIMAIKWLVKHYLSELRPNGGSSMRDSIDRLERQVEKIMDILLERK